MTRPAPRSIQSDVLVIGGGGAGSVAAIAAATAGASVILVCKGKVGRSGATPTAGFDFADFMADARSVIEVLGWPEGDLRDSPREFMLDVLQEGEYINHQKLVDVYVRDAPYRIRDLIDWGMKVTHIDSAHGSRFPRGVMATGPDLGRTLRRAVEKHRATMVEDVQVTDLLTRDGRAAGAVGLEQRTGTAIVFRAKAVILATGGWQTAYPWTTATSDLSGDGQAMAYRAGAELVDMEMVKFLSGVIIGPPAWRHSIVPLTLPAGVLLNCHGEAFLRRYDPECADRPLAQWPRRALQTAVREEILAGRGSPSGGVYFSLEHLPSDLIDDMVGRSGILNWSAERLDFQSMFEYIKAGNSLEVTADAAHYMLGGIRIDETCATSLSGLFGAGECTGGTFGANRVCSALTAMVVEGHIAGSSAAGFAMREGDVEPDRKDIAELVDTVYRPLERARGVRPPDLRQRLQELANGKVGSVRNSTDLTEALKELGEIHRQVEQVATASKSLRFNREWIEALQIRSMLPVVEVSARSALLRTESRGAHYRSDYPHKDNVHWLRNIVARKDGDQCDLRCAPVVASEVPLPPGAPVGEKLVSEE